MLPCYSNVVPVHMQPLPLFIASLNAKRKPNKSGMMQSVDLQVLLQLMSHTGEVNTVLLQRLAKYSTAASNKHGRERKKKIFLSLLTGTGRHTGRHTKNCGPSITISPGKPAERPATLSTRPARALQKQPQLNSRTPKQPR